MILTIIGGMVVTIVCLWPINSLWTLLWMSDYSIKDTLKWNFFKERLWIECVLIPVACAIWWYLVGSHLHISVR